MRVSLLVFLIFFGTMQPAVAGAYDYWQPYYIERGQTLSEIFRSLVRNGLEAVSLDEFITKVKEKNPHIVNRDLIVEGTTMLLPVKMRETVQKVEEKQTPVESIPIPSVKYSSHFEPIIGYSRIDIIEKDDDSSTQLLSKQNYGVSLGMVREEAGEPETRLRVLAYQHKYDESDTKDFESDKARIHAIRYDLRWRSPNGFFYGPIGSYAESAYLSALDNTILVIDPVFQPGLGLNGGYSHTVEKVNAEYSLDAIYLLSSHASTFRVRHGNKYQAQVLVRWIHDADYVSRFRLWYSIKQLNSSVSVQTNQDLGIGIGVEFH